MSQPKQPKPPAKVKVGCHDYEVVVSQPLADLADVSYGVTYAHKTQIIASPNQSPSQLRDTILHEVLHAICADTGLAEYVDAPDGTTLPQKLEELVVRRLTPALLALLRDNPKLVEYLRA